MAVRWPWTRKPKDEAATIATAAVKAEALTLVGDLRSTLKRLDEVLRSESETSNTVAPTRQGET